MTALLVPAGVVVHIQLLRLGYLDSSDDVRSGRFSLYVCRSAPDGEMLILASWATISDNMRAIGSRNEEE
jgi:hypothetical protein